MDSTRQDRAPGGDDRRRLTPRMELDGPYPGTLLDAGFYQIAAGGFANIITGKANDQIDHEWNA